MNAWVGILLIIVGIVLARYIYPLFSAWRLIHNIKKNSRIGKEILSGELSKMYFTTTREITVEYHLNQFSAAIMQIRVDGISKRVAICNCQTAEFTCLDFKDILECNLFENGLLVCDANSALVGGTGFGMAVIRSEIAAGRGDKALGLDPTRNPNGVHSLVVQILTTNVDEPYIELETMGPPCRMGDGYKPIFNHAFEIFYIFNYIILDNRLSAGDEVS